MPHIALVYMDIFKNNKSGELLVYDGKIKRTLLFLRGFLSAGWSTLPDEKIGQVLLKLKLIDPEHLSSLRKISEKKMRFGDYLVSEGIITRKNLNLALLQQLQRIFLMTFQMEGAEIKFQEKTPSLPKEYFQIVLPPLVAKGIRSFFSPSAQKFMEDKDYPYIINENLQIQLEPDEEMIFREINGEASVGEISLKTGKDRKFVLKTLFILYCVCNIDFRQGDLRESLEREEIEKLVEEIEEIYASLNALTPQQLLKLDKSFDKEELRERYYQLVKKYHPDRFRSLSDPDLTKKSEEVFIKISEAYQALESFPSKAHDVMIKTLTQPSPSDAEKKYLKAKTLFDSGMFWEAIYTLNEALRIDKSNFRYHLLLGKAQAKFPHLKKDAEISFLKSIEIESWNPDAYFELGKLYLSEGMKIRARIMLEKAVSMDPQNEEAHRLLNGIK